MQLSQASLAKLNEIDPNSYLVHQVSGEIMESMNNLDGALLEYKKAVELAPARHGTHYHLANAYWTLFMWEPAKKEFLAELVNDPQNCQAHWKLETFFSNSKQNRRVRWRKKIKRCTLPDRRSTRRSRPRLVEARAIRRGSKRLAKNRGRRPRGTQASFSSGAGVPRFGALSAGPNGNAYVQQAAGRSSSSESKSREADPAKQRAEHDSIAVLLNPRLMRAQKESRGTRPRLRR